jgi:hypothetical protein
LLVVVSEVSDEVGEEVAATVVGMLVLEGEAVGEVLGLEEELVAGRSCWRYSTHIGCAHIVSGPVTASWAGEISSEPFRKTGYLGPKGHGRRLPSNPSAMPDD